MCVSACATLNKSKSFIYVKTLSPWCGYTRNTRILFLKKRSARIKNSMFKIREKPSPHLTGIIWRVIVMFIAPSHFKTLNLRTKWEFYQTRNRKKRNVRLSFDELPVISIRDEVIILVLHPNNRYKANRIQCIQNAKRFIFIQPSERFRKYENCFRSRLK